MEAVRTRGSSPAKSEDENFVSAMEVVCTFEGCNNPIGEWQLSRKRTGYCTLHAPAGFHDVPDYRDATLGLDLVSYISTYGVTATSPSAITSTNQDIATLRQVFEGHQNLYYVDTEFFIRSGKYYAYEIALYNWCGALVVDIYVTIPGRLDNPADAITLADSVKFLIKTGITHESVIVEHSKNGCDHLALK